MTSILTRVRGAPRDASSGSAPEGEAHAENRHTMFDLNRCALVIIDAWESHPTGHWILRARPHMEEKLKPLLRVARQGGLRVIHAAHGEPIAAAAAPLASEVVLDRLGLLETAAFAEYLSGQNIDTLFYAGYASNWCVLHRPVGMIRMRRSGFRVILVRDCTLAYETRETLPGEWANRFVVHLAECRLGASTSLDDLSAAIRQANETACGICGDPE